MPVDETSDDYYRYIEYLQRQMLPASWEAYFDAERWAPRTEEILNSLEQMSLDNESAQFLISHMRRLTATRRTTFEVQSTEAIFQTAFEEVQAAAAKIGLLPIRPVEVITSTDVSVSLAARPGPDKHLLFAGLGTATYCNYWSKAITAVVMAIPNAIGLKRVADTADMERIFQLEPSGLLLASKLALHYAFFQTLLGFGPVEQPENFLAYRVSLLHAMETASIAHEYAHFVADERISEFSGVLDAQMNHQLEHFCDELGTQISREVGSTHENFLTFSGIGSLALFRTVQLCKDLREHLIDAQVIPQSRPVDSVAGSSHPNIEDRIHRLKNNIISKTAEDQRDNIETFLNEYDTILVAICGTVLQVGKPTKLGND